MRVAFGSDEDAPLVGEVLSHLAASGHDVEIVSRAGWWPEVGRDVGRLVAEGRADLGVVCCWTGTGVSIAANKVPGVRAALCRDATTADGARRWNDANVLALSIRATTGAVAREIVDAFVGGSPDPDEAAAWEALE